MEPAKAPLVYTFYDEVGEITEGEWFSLKALPHHFICRAEFLQPGDKVKVIIAKCPPSAPTPPDPSSNS